MAQHTLGPWTIEQRPGRKISIHAETWGHLGEIYQTETTKEEGLANAHLIAAAPDMYDALHKAHDAIDELFARLVIAEESFMPSKSGSPWKALLEINEAIAKAEKES